jgi:hypothetical protein
MKKLACFWRLDVYMDCYQSYKEINILTYFYWVQLDMNYWLCHFANTVYGGHYTQGTFDLDVWLDNTKM